MDGAPPTDARRTSFAASPVGLRIARLGLKRSQRFWLDCNAGPIPESSGTGGFNWPVGNLAVRTKSQTDLAGNEGGYLLKIPISAALDWPSGRDSPAANQDRDQIPLP